MELGLADRSVVVTGAGSNIGRAIALGFAAEGARLTLGDVDDEQTARVAAAATDLGAPGDDAGVAMVAALIACAAVVVIGADVVLVELAGDAPVA